MSGKRTHYLARDTMKFAFDKYAEPAVHVHSGDEITFQTEDANVHLITRETDIFDDFQKLYRKGNGCNPITGPVYIEEAKQGDYIAVEILSIQVGGEEQSGYSALYPHLGALASEFSIQDDLEPRTKICGIHGDLGTFRTHDGKREITFDLNRFIGTIGVAPKEDRRSSYYHGKDFCGNVDCPDVTVGATVILPANVDGALLSIGDVHGAQGDGEITGCALECRSEVRVRVRALSPAEAQYVSWPQVNTTDSIGTLVCGGALNMTDQIRAGYVDLVYRMERYYGFDRLDAYQLLNLVGRVRIGQVIDSASCVVKIERKYL